MHGGRFQPLKMTLAIAGTGLALSPSFATDAGYPDAFSTVAPQPDPRAVRCLAAAISYEAGNESIEGQQAVAQVILNRVRHPAYPKSVCGVVFQGSERRTGCQFTFTCDGSLARQRSAQSMATATAIAEQMLSGTTSTLVGGATHYHANYVSPYWAPGLVKVRQIGAHIFYRMPSAAVTAATGEWSAGAIEDDSRLYRVASVTAQRAVTTRRPEPVTFSPWGLPTLTVSRSGKVTALAAAN